MLLKADPSLVDDAMRSRVLIASPMNLLALLLAAHRGWQDFRFMKNQERFLTSPRNFINA